jgi:TetR/AcrR family transcriptional regulator, transcriptional repressor for nem operon
MGRVSDAKERLLSSAISLLWQRGYASVSVDELCETAAVKKGSFYHFFKSKDDLVLAALEAHWAARKPVLDAILALDLPALVRLCRFLDSVIAHQSELRKDTGHVLGCFYFCLGNECSRNARINERVQSIIASYVRYYEVLLEEAHRTGALTVADPAARALSLFAMMEGLLGQARIQDSLSPIATLREQAMGLLGVGSGAEALCG